MLSVLTLVEESRFSSPTDTLEIQKKVHGITPSYIEIYLNGAMLTSSDIVVDKDNGRAIRMQGLHFLQADTVTVKYYNNIGDIFNARWGS